MVAESRPKVLHQMHKHGPFDWLVWNYRDTSSCSLVPLEINVIAWFLLEEWLTVPATTQTFLSLQLHTGLSFPCIFRHWKDEKHMKCCTTNQTITHKWVETNKTFGGNRTCVLIHTLCLICILSQGSSYSHQLCFKIRRHRPSVSLWIAHEAESWVTRLRGLRALTEWDNVEWRWLVLVLAAGDGGNDVVVMMAVMATVMCGTSYCWRLHGGSEVFILRALEFSICALVCSIFM